MKRFAGIFTIGLLLFGGQLMAAQVTNVELNYQDFAVVARIDVEGQVRFTHETEVPKNGRPDRVIVDVLSATHELGAKNFLDLPECVIQGIRSSQFAVTPEKIVRIVFDLKKSPVYKVDVKDNSIYLYFTDTGDKAFTSWSSSAAVRAEKKPSAPVAASAPKPEKKAPQASSAAQKNKAIESDRMASLASGKKAAGTPAAKPSVSKTPEKAKPSGFSQYLARTDSAPTAKKAEPAETKEKPTVRQAKPVKKASVKKADAKADSAPEAKPSVTPKKASPKKSSKEVTPSPLPKSPSSKNLASEKKSEPKAQGQIALARKAANDKASKSQTPDAKPSAKSSKKVAQESAKKPPKKTSTSRFRRSVSNKIKGTLVAEFPKRLVVKYKSSHYRDPFRTLIDASRTQNDPVEQRIANVEGLKLVGIIDSDGGTNRALFEDTDGYGYMLKSGDKVRNGYVLRVETDRVYFQIFEYGWSRTVALKLD